MAGEEILALGIWFWVLIVWSGIWKGVALWGAGRNNHLTWFIVLLVINTAGILPIIYLFGFQPRKGIKTITRPKSISKPTKRKKRK